MKQEDRKTLIEKLDEYIGLLPSELWEIGYEGQGNGNGDGTSDERRSR